MLGKAVGVMVVIVYHSHTWSISVHTSGTRCAHLVGMTRNMNKENHTQEEANASHIQQTMVTV